MERHELTFPMVWDESFESWRFYGISGQPAYVLLDAAGELVDASYGMWPADIADRL